MKHPFLTIGQRKIGLDYPPLVVAEIGINHEGSFSKAKKMIFDASQSGAECVKFQCHIIEDEMSPIAQKVIPGHTKESIWDIMSRCAFNEEKDRELQKYTESLGMIYLSTPFSRAAANRLQNMKVGAYKIGSGECNNYPLVEHIAAFKKPTVMSTGMNNISSIKKSVSIFRKYKIPYALLHCTSIYPTPYEKVRLGALSELRQAFPDAVIGLSDHTVDNYACLGAVSLGASILERHFTSSKKWPGPDIAVSMDPHDLKNLINGSRAIFAASGGQKSILSEEKSTIDFAYACVVAIADIKKGEKLTRDNIWVKRPGTGEIKAVHFKNLLGKTVKQAVKNNEQLKWKMVNL